MYDLHYGLSEQVVPCEVEILTRYSERKTNPLQVNRGKHQSYVNAATPRVGGGTEDRVKLLGGPLVSGLRRLNRAWSSICIETAQDQPTIVGAPSMHWRPANSDQADHHRRNSE